MQLYFDVFGGGSPSAKLALEVLVAFGSLRARALPIVDVRKTAMLVARWILTAADARCR